MDKTVNFSPQWETIAVREEFRVSVIMQRGSGRTAQAGQLWLSFKTEAEDIIKLLFLLLKIHARYAIIYPV